MGPARSMSSKISEPIVLDSSLEDYAAGSADCVDVEKAKSARASASNS